MMFSCEVRKEEKEEKEEEREEEYQVLGVCGRVTRSTKERVRELGTAFEMCVCVLFPQSPPRQRKLTLHRRHALRIPTEIGQKVHSKLILP